MVDTVQQAHMAVLSSTTASCKGVFQLWTLRARSGLACHAHILGLWPKKRCRYTTKNSVKVTSRGVIRATVTSRGVIRAKVRPGA